jgi:tetratricopeptide (TPR) repeat protein
LTYLWLGNIQQAKDDYERGWELDRTNINAAWMSVWIEMDKERTGIETATRLEKSAAANPEDYVAFVCLGVAFGLRNKLREGLTQLERAISLVPEYWDAYFWKGMICAYLGRNLVAIEAFNKAIDIGLPPLLLTPLYWLEKDRPNFYSEYAAPVLTRFNV